MTVVKICGITTLQDGVAAASAGADLLGFNFYPDSPRYVSPEQAQTLVRGLHERLGERAPLMIGIFVNEPLERITSTMRLVSLDYAQLSGDELPSLLAALGRVAFKGVRAPDPATLRLEAERYAPFGPDEPTAPRILVDAYHPQAYGGTGRQADWETVTELSCSLPNLLLAGGLTPDNVAEAVQRVRPWGVDVASGVERVPGVKDKGAVRAFIRAAKTALPTAEREIS